MKRILFSGRLFELISEEVVLNLRDKEAGTNHFFSVDTRNCFWVNDGHVEAVVSDTTGNCFDFVRGGITFWPKPDPQEGFIWPKKGRQELKVGRFIKMVQEIFAVYDIKNSNGIEGELRDKALARFTDIVADKLRAFEVDINPAITRGVAKIYKLPTATNSGFLGRSCMRPESECRCRMFTGFFRYIPNIEVVYETDSNGCLLYRALLWTVDYNGRKIKFLDRIYGTTVINVLLINWAEEQGFAYRRFSQDAIVYNDERGIGISCEIDEDANDYLEDGSPYIDTLYVLRNGNTLSNRGSGIELNYSSGESPFNRD